MSDQEQTVPPKGKLKKKSKTAQQAGPELSLDLEETFNPANAKDKDFDLNLKDMNFQAKKGQAGTRTTSGDGGNLDRTIDPRSG